MLHIITKGIKPRESLVMKMVMVMIMVKINKTSTPGYHIKLLLNKPSLRKDRR